MIGFDAVKALFKQPNTPWGIKVLLEKYQKLCGERLKRFEES